MPDIFISHAEQDRDAADRIASFLEGQGRSVWRKSPAERNVDAMTVLGTARAVLAIWSSSSLSSPFVLQHAIAARDTRKLLHVTRGVQRKQIPLQQDGPMFDVTDLLQISLTLLPYCRAR